MMAVLAANPVRRKNLFATRIGVDLQKLSDDLYQWRFEAHETKTKDPIHGAKAPILGVNSVPAICCPD
jgi:hypothetical protein